MSQVELTTLGKSCEFFNGKAHEKSIDENGKYIVVNSKFISQEGRVVKRTKEQMFPLYKGEIVMVMSDVPNGKALAKCFIIDQDDTYSLNQRICCIRSKEFDTKYLYYQLNRHEHFLAFNNGENQTNLRKDDILDCPLIKPSLEEQRRIATELDAIYSKVNLAKENITKNIENTNDIFQSILIEVLKGNVFNSETNAESLLNKLKGAKEELIKTKAIMDKKDNNKYPIKDLPFEIPKNWNWVYLSDLSIIQEGPGIRKHQYKNDGIQFLTVTNILEGNVDLEKSKKYIS
jgi:type I restriction enzyme S subunit